MEKAKNAETCGRKPLPARKSADYNTSYQGKGGPKMTALNVAIAEDNPKTMELLKDMLKMKTESKWWEMQKRATRLTK